MTWFCLAACPSTVRAQAAVEAGGGTPRFHAPIDLIPAATGTHTWPVTTTEPRAQAYFDQGMQLRWAYTVEEAARSMAEARRIDSDCAMCWWGEAFALGSFLNGAMTAQQARYAHAAIERAAGLADDATVAERDLIMATRSRYPADYDPGNRRPVDTAFAEAMADVYN
jgi:hypothetical protein